jgi:hypothetical protein
MITYVVLYPGDIWTGARFACDDGPDLETAADSLASHLGYRNRDEMINDRPGLIIGFAPLH